MSDGQINSLFGFFIAFAACAAISACQEKKQAFDPSLCPLCPRPDRGPTRIVIIGDRTGHADDELWRSSLRDAASLKPDLAIGVGDFIEGYQHDDLIKGASAEWDHALDIAKASLGDIPLLSAAGNHDVWSEKSEQLFQEKMGHPVNFSFDAGAARIIIFDTSRINRETDIEGEQLDWLVHELNDARRKAARIVITHVPLFAIEPGGSYGSPLHDVLIAGGADWVITGHWHHAMSDDRDDIHYRSIGPSGAPPYQPNHPENGNFTQFGWLTIDRDRVEMSLVRNGGIVPSDTFYYDLNQLSWNIENRAVLPDGFEFDPVQPRQTGSFSVTVKNVTAERLNGEIAFGDTHSKWRIAPAKRLVKLDPNESKTIRLHFSHTGQALFPGFRARLAFPWPEGGTYQLDTEIKPILVRRVPKIAASPDIDGSLDDKAWPAVAYFGPLQQVKDKTLPGSTKAMVAQRNAMLYLGIRLDEQEPKEQCEEADHILIFLDANPEDAKHVELALNAGGWVSDRLVGALDGSHTTISWTDQKQIAVKSDEHGWQAELAIPLDEIGLTPGNKRLGFNLLRERMCGGIASSQQWQPLLEHDMPSFGILVLQN